MKDWHPADIALFATLMVLTGFAIGFATPPAQGAAFSAPYEYTEGKGIITVGYCKTREPAQQVIDLYSTGEVREGNAAYTSFRDMGQCVDGRTPVILDALLQCGEHQSQKLSLWRGLSPKGPVYVILGGRAEGCDVS